MNGLEKKNRIYNCIEDLLNIFSIYDYDNAYTGKRIQYIIVKYD